MMQPIEVDKELVSATRVPLEKLRDRLRARPDGRSR